MHTNNTSQDKRILSTLHNHLAKKTQDSEYENMVQTIDERHKLAQERYQNILSNKETLMEKSRLLYKIVIA